MSTEEQTEALREWFIALSKMIGGELESDSTLEQGAEWFGDLGDETLSQVYALAINNPAIDQFFATGRLLMKEVLTG